MALMSLARSVGPSTPRRSRGARLCFRVFPLQKRQDLFHERIRGDAVLLAEDWDRAVLDKLIGPANAHHRGIDHLAVQMLHDRATEAVVQNMVLDRANDIDAASKELQGPRIERLDPARIDKRD